MHKGGYFYILSNKHRTTLYVGVTAELIRRTSEHKMHLNLRSFSARYNVAHLVYYEHFLSIEEAIAREKEVKKWSGAKKEVLIVSTNPEWRDLYEDLF